MRTRSGNEGHEGLLGDLFLNLAAVVIFAIAVIAVERPLRADARPAGAPVPGLVFHLCGDRVSIENGPTLHRDALLDSDVIRRAIAEAPDLPPVLRIGPASDTAAFLLATQLARSGKTEPIFVEGGCGTSATAGGRP